VVSQEDSNRILGEDLSMAEVIEMTNKIVVDKAYGRHFSEKNLKVWAISSLGSNFNPPPKIPCLYRGGL
jgi:hypothetical protein